MSRTARIFIGAIILILVVGAGLLWRRQTASPSLTELPTVRIGYVNALGAITTFVARDEKLFEAQGLKPEFVLVQSSNQLTEGLIRGDFDVTTFNGVLTLLNAEAADPGKVKIFSLSDITQEHPYDAMIVKKDSPLQSLKDLEGKKIGTFPGSTATSLLKRQFLNKQIDSTNMTFVPMPPQNQLATLESGAIDAVFTYEPNMALATEEQGARKISGSIIAELYDHSPLATGMISSKFIQDKPEIAQKAVSAIDAANHFITTNETRTREIAKEQFKLSPGVTSKLSLMYLSESTKLDRAHANRFIDFLVSIGELKSSLNTDTLYYQP